MHWRLVPPNGSAPPPTGNPGSATDVRGNLCSTKKLSKDGMRPQLIPEHENECLSPAQTKMLY